MSLHSISPLLPESPPLHRTREGLRTKRAAGVLTSQQLIWPLFVQEGVIRSN